MRKTNYLYWTVVCMLFLFTYSCNEEDNRNAHTEMPIKFNFQILDDTISTRTNSTLAVNKTVYVAKSQSGPWYPYTYDDQNSRWECNTGNPITWSGQTMKLWAVVRNDNSGMNVTTTNIEANQTDNGYLTSDFLACVGTFSYTTGTINMKLEHQVARLVVNVSNCFDASKMTCQTVAEFPTEGQISIGENAVTVSAKDGSATSVVNLYRTAYNIHTNTATFMAYLLPQAQLGSAFKLTCGSTLQYTSNGTAMGVKLEAGKTTMINLSLQEIQTVWNYGIDEENANGACYEGTYQTFTAPVTAQYKLEVWGAQGGSYVDETKTPYIELCDMGDQMFTPWDNLKRGAKNCEGGKGAYVTGVINLNKNDILYIYVGKQASKEFNHPLGYKSGNFIRYELDADGYYIIPPSNNAPYNQILHEMDGGWNGGGTMAVSTIWGESTSVTVRTAIEQIEHAKIKKVNADDEVIWQNTDTTIIRCGIRPQYGGGGGGATDIALKSGDWNSADHLYSRIIVAGGGGGACYYPRETGFYDGGYGGGGMFLGTSSWTGGSGDGYSTARGAGGSLSGAGSNPSGKCAYPLTVSEIQTRMGDTFSFYESYNLRVFTTIDAGFGYGGGSIHAGEGQGGGGGGWYGGSTGGGGNSNGAGGGGSSYAYTSVVSYNSKPLNEYHPNFGKDGSYIPETKYLLTDVANQGGVNTGNGRARITLIAK